MTVSMMTIWFVVLPPLLPLLVAAMPAKAACASWTFGGKFPICGQPEKIQLKINAKISKNLLIFNILLIHILGMTWFMGLLYLRH